MQENHSATVGLPLGDLRAKYLQPTAGVLCTLYVISLATSMGGMELFSSLILITAFVDIVYARLQGETTQWPLLSLPLCAFTLVACTSIVLGPGDLSAKLYDLGRMRFFLLYFFLAHFLQQFVPQYARWLRPLAIACLVVGTYGVVQHFIPVDLIRPEGKKAIYYALPHDKIGPLVVGTFNHYLTFAAIYLMFASVFLALGLFSRSQYRWIFLLLGALLVLDTFWTHSRAAWVAVLACLFLLACFKGWRWGLLACVGLALVVGGALAVDPGMRGKLERTFSSKPGAKADFYRLGPRLRLWAVQWEIIKDYPLLGVGYNNNERLSRVYYDKLFPNAPVKIYGHAHSNPLQILATTGVVGFVCFLWLWWATLSSLLRAAMRFASQQDWFEYALCVGIFVGFIGFHIQGLSQWNFGDAEVLHSVVFFWAVTNLLQKKSLSSLRTEGAPPSVHSRRYEKR